MLRRVVHLGARPKKPGGQHKRRPPRKAREAKLCVKATRLTLKRPLHVKQGPACLTLNFVHVYEPPPPPGQQAVQWRLVTSQPIQLRTIGRGYEKLLMAELGWHAALGNL